MIATPSLSMTTPTSSVSALREGPMNIVTSGSLVSYAFQWFRNAWSMSSSATPCLRADGSMSPHRSYDPIGTVNTC